MPRRRDAVDVAVRESTRLYTTAIDATADVRAGAAPHGDACVWKFHAWNALANGVDAISTIMKSTDTIAMQ